MLEVDACNKRKRVHARKQCLGELALNKFQLLRRPLFSPLFSPLFPPLRRNSPQNVRAGDRIIRPDGRCVLNQK